MNDAFIEFTKNEYAPYIVIGIVILIVIIIKFIIFSFIKK